MHHLIKRILDVCITINIFQKSYTLTKLQRIEKFTIMYRDVNTPLSIFFFFPKKAATLIKDIRDLNVSK